MVLMTFAAVEHLQHVNTVSRPLALCPTYAKNLEHIAVGLVTGKLISRTIETEHKLFWNA
jgi:hypothetical protein